MATKTNKSLDCVALKRKAQLRIQRELKGLTPQQQLTYIRRAARTGPFAKFWANTPRNMNEPRTK